MIRATQDIHLNADRTAVVPPSDPDAMFLFAPAGSEVSAEDVRKYGIGADLVSSDEPAALAAPVVAPVDDSALQAAEAEANDLRDKLTTVTQERDALQAQVADLQGQLDAAGKTGAKSNK